MKFCPLCAAPHRNKMDNMWKLYVKASAPVVSIFILLGGDCGIAADTGRPSAIMAHISVTAVAREGRGSTSSGRSGALRARCSCGVPTQHRCGTCSWVT